MPPRRSARSAASASAYFAGKSEHYHIPLGHGFPGYALLDKARALGIPNATHNNTRGYITRLLERRLIAAANGRPMDEPLPQTLLQARLFGSGGGAQDDAQPL